MKPLFGLALGLLLVACSPATQAPATTQPRAVDRRAPLVSATGQVVPEREALLSLPAGGVIEQVRVEKGATVQTGEVLLQLEGSAQQAAAVSAAELALAQAQFALNQLYQDTDLRAAEALRSAENAEQALEDLHQVEQPEAQALRTVAVAERRLEMAEQYLSALTQTPTQNALEQAADQLLLAENKLEKTAADIADLEWQLKKYSGFAPVASQLRQALKFMEIQRTQDQLGLNRAERKYHDLLAPPDATEVAVAEANYLTAQATLAQTQRDLGRIQTGPQAGEVAVLAAQIEQGYRDYETYRVGPDPEEVALAEARIVHAAAQVAAAQATLADLELVAPFDGVIAEVYVNPREWLTPGRPVLLLADLAQLQVETTDLGEIDVAHIQVGDPALVTFDALPELRLAGTITRIAPKTAPGSGVNYPVTIELSALPPELRWGMTAFVDIETE